MKILSKIKEKKRKNYNHNWKNIFFIKVDSENMKNLNKYFFKNTIK